MSKIALRAYVKNREEEKHNKFEKNIDYSRVFVFDTETTTDEYQNLKFGSFVIYNNEVLEQTGIFYNPECVTKEELKTLSKF